MIYEQISQASDRTEKKNEHEDFSASSYFIKNSTGEILMFKTPNQTAFQEILPDEEYPLDFQVVPTDNSIFMNYRSGKSTARKFSFDKVSDEDINTFASSNGSQDEDSEISDEENPVFIDDEKGLKDFRLTILQARSIYRRRNYKFFKSEPKKVLF